MVIQAMGVCADQVHGCGAETPMIPAAPAAAAAMGAVEVSEMGQPEAAGSITSARLRTSPKSPAPEMRKRPVSRMPAVPMVTPMDGNEVRCREGSGTVREESPAVVWSVTPRFTEPGSQDASPVLTRVGVTRQAAPAGTVTVDPFSTVVSSPGQTT